MAPTGSNAGTKLSMKLLVDTKAGRVLYAEVGHDVVDFLFYLLTLPVGAVVKILRKDSMVGSVGNIYGSVEELDETYFRSDEAKDALLSPGGEYSDASFMLLQDAAEPVLTSTVYQCAETKRDNCCDYVAVEKDMPCRQCGGAMNLPMKLMGPSCRGSGGGAATGPTLFAVAEMGFVREVVKYMVMDDLKVKPLSTISSLTALNAMGITDMSSLKEKTVRLGSNEGLALLRASLQSKTALTDVFLGKKHKAATPPNKNNLKLSAASMKNKQNASCCRARGLDFVQVPNKKKRPAP